MPSLTSGLTVMKRSHDLNRQSWWAATWAVKRRSGLPSCGSIPQCCLNKACAGRFKVTATWLGFLFSLCTSAITARCTDHLGYQYIMKRAPKVKKKKKKIINIGSRLCHLAEVNPLATHFDRLERKANRWDHVVHVVSDVLLFLWRDVLVFSRPSSLLLMHGDCQLQSECSDLQSKQLRTLYKTRTKQIKTRKRETVRWIEVEGDPSFTFTENAFPNTLYSATLIMVLPLLFLCFVLSGVCVGLIKTTCSWCSFVN